MSINKSYALMGVAIATSSIVLPLTQVSQVEAESQTITVTSRVNFRKGPSKSYSIIKKLYKGYKLEYLGKDGNWIKVKYNGDTGYVYKDYVTSLTTVSSRVNFRKGPSTSYSSIIKIAKGNKIEVLGVNGKWIQSKYNGEIGYIYHSYVLGYNQNTTTKYVKASVGLNVRKGPSTGYTILGKLSYNSSVEVIEISNGWAKINYNSDEAYVNNSYLQNKKETLNSTSTATSSSNVSSSVSELIAYAQKFLGKPYVWGSQGPNSFDCSGFTYYIFKNKVGITLPRNSTVQSTYGKYISKSNIKAGDLLFFDTNGSNNGVVSHVGLYIGNGQMIHASYSQGKIVTANFNSSYYQNAFVNARRVL